MGWKEKGNERNRGGININVAGGSSGMQDEQVKEVLTRVMG